MTCTHIAVTGTAWMGEGVGSIQSVIEEMLREAQEEVAVAIYAIRGSADLFLDWVEAALVRGVKVVMVVNKISQQPRDVVFRLEALGKMYPWFVLYDFTGDGHGELHAKAIVVDRR